MSAFAILPVMFPQSGATEVDAGYEAMKGDVSVNRMINLLCAV